MLKDQSIRKTTTFNVQDVLMPPLPQDVAFLGGFLYMAVSQAFLALNRKLAAQKEREEDLNKVREALNRSTKSIESKKKNRKRFTYPNDLLVKP